MGEVWAFAEVMEHLGLSRKRVAELMDRPDFPPPVQVLSVGRIWRADDIREYARRRRERFPGRVEDETDSG